MRRTARYFKDDKEVTAQEALRGNTLRDGFSIRVPTIFADARQQFGDARAFWDRNKAALLVTDVRRIGGTEGNRPGFRVLDNDLGRSAKDAALRQHEQYLRDAWRQDAAVEEEDDDEARRECPDCDGAGEINGKQCARCGGSGEVDDVDEEAEAVADDRTRPPYGSQDSVDQIAQQHRQRMARIYQDHAQWLSEQWK